MKPYNKQGSTKGEEVREMFDNIAPTYDRLNHILSFQIDKLWRRRVVNLVAQNCPAQGNILDVATGTGDLAIALATKLRGCKVLGVDPSQGMLDVAATKIADLEGRVTLQQSSAELLPLGSELFDCVTASFGVRNFSDLRRGIGEMVRVTRPGGVVVILEFSIPSNAFVRWGYGLYSNHLLPRIGALLSRDRAAYDYLPASVEEFESSSQMVSIMEQTGLTRCRAISQSLGIAHIYIGYTPSCHCGLRPAIPRLTRV